MKHIGTPSTALQPATHYYVLHQDGYYVGASFEAGTLGPLSLFAPSVDNSQLQFVRELSESEKQHLAKQTVMTWYVLTHNAHSSIALLRCRNDPYHTELPSTVGSGRGQVGV